MSTQLHSNLTSLEWISLLTTTTTKPNTSLYRHKGKVGGRTHQGEVCQFTSCEKYFGHWLRVAWLDSWGQWLMVALLSGLARWLWWLIMPCRKDVNGEKKQRKTDCLVCKKQYGVSKSSTEAEYRSMLFVWFESVWLWGRLREIDFPQQCATLFANKY